jgi:PAS domain S-box-containing protein
MLTEADSLYCLLEAENVIACLEMCLTQTVDTILLDDNLPNAAGLQLLANLLAQSKEENFLVLPPVVMVSGSDETASAQSVMNTAIQAIKLGAEDYLIKRDLTPEGLQLSLQNAITNARLRRQQAELSLHEANQNTVNSWESISDAYVNPSTVGLGGSFQDISDHKQAEEKIRQQLGELESIYKMAPIGLCFVDTNLRFVRINEQLAEINGLPVADHLGRSIRDILPEMADQLEPIYRQAIASGEPILNWEVKVISPAQPGVERYWSVCYYPQQGDNSRVVGVNVVVQEISDRKQAELDLQEKTQLLQQIINSIGDGLLLANLQGEFVLFNQAAEKMFGQLTNECPNDEWSRTYGLFLPDQQTLFPDADLPLAKAIRGEFVEDVEVFVRRNPTSGGHWVSISGYPVHNASGQVTGGVVTCRDISDRKTAEAERERLLSEAQTSRTEAEAANRSKDEFVAMVAHELRSPLSSVMGWAQLLQTRTFNEETKAKALTTICRNTQAQVRLVEDLLDISRIASGNLHLTVAPVNLATVIRAALDIVLPLAQAKQIHLDSQLILSPQVEGDFNRLQQIVVNLLTNAIKFTPERGHVEIQLSQVKSQVQLCVSDTGKGIAAEFLPQIFERFKQGQQNTGTKDGLGLGLAIVKSLTELHQGTIVAESEGLGKGATFTMRLPLLGTPAL